ncbi:MAG: sensor histidine kinase [Ignavibacteriaceae bacterium]
MKTNVFDLTGLSLSRKPAASNEATNYNISMNRKKAYWLSQLSGWTFFALINITVISSFDKFSWQKLILIFYLSFMGVSFTHIFRYFVKKNGWINLPLKKLVRRVLLACVIIGTVMFSLYFFANIEAGIFHETKLKIGPPLMGIFNLSSVILLWALIYFSVHFFENYKRAEIESLIWEAAVKDFELKTLKSQLNPHFMFNALNSIRALIEEEPASAQTAVTKLSNILRYSLKMERTETVSLDEEMQAVADYLALEAIRFEERLKYEIVIDPKSSKIEIPPMMIQTLVENGIKHGISKKTEGGTIFISTTNNDSELRIKIKNSGSFDEKALQKSSGFGINNTKHRLHLIYGEKAFFSIKNESENEVTAEIVIPIGGTKNESLNN